MGSVLPMVTAVGLFESAFAGRILVGGPDGVIVAYDRDGSAVGAMTAPELDPAPVVPAWWARLREKARGMRRRR